MSEEVKNEFTFENPEYRQTYWHTCSHVMAQAVKRLWPEVKLAITWEQVWTCWRITASRRRP